MGGKEAIIRNIARCREIYIRYSRSFMDRKFRLIHFDKIFLDYEISHMVPVTKLYPDDNCNPLRSIFKLIQLHDWSSFMIGPIRFSIWKSYQSFILFRQFALYLVNAASILWPESELDTAIQHLFDKYLNKTPTNENGILLSDECRDFIPHFFVIWENCECKMTARNDFHLRFEEHY